MFLRREFPCSTGVPALNILWGSASCPTGGAVAGWIPEGVANKIMQKPIRVKRMYSSSRLVTLFGFAFGTPASEELLRSLIAESLVRAHGVVDTLPVAQFLIERRHLPRAGSHLIEFLGVGTLGTFHSAVEFRRPGWQYEQP